MYRTYRKKIMTLPNNLKKNLKKKKYFPDGNTVIL